MSWYLPHDPCRGAGRPPGRETQNQRRRTPCEGESFIRRSPHTRQHSHRVSMAHALGEGGLGHGLVSRWRAPRHWRRRRGLVHDGEVATLTRVDERRRAPVVAGFNVGVVGEECLDDREVAEGARAYQRRLVVDVTLLDVGAGGESCTTTARWPWRLASTSADLSPMSRTLTSARAARAAPRRRGDHAHSRAPAPTLVRCRRTR